MSDDQDNQADRKLTDYHGKSMAMKADLELRELLSRVVGDPQTLAEVTRALDAALEWMELNAVGETTALAARATGLTQGRFDDLFEATIEEMVWERQQHGWSEDDQWGAIAEGMHVYDPSDDQEPVEGPAPTPEQQAASRRACGL